ncbi:stage II sporulation protein M [Archaeoglobus sp.]
MRDERSLIIISSLMLTMLFIISIFAGYMVGKNYPVEEELRKFFEYFGGFLENPVILTLIIFANNAGKSLIAMLGGFFFGIFPVMFVALNGYIVGVVVSWRTPEWGLWKVVLAILPHGILEIPAIIIACAYGVWLGYRFYLALFKGEEFKIYLLRAIRAYVKLVLPLLLIAAFVEAFITPMVVGML